MKTLTIMATLIGFLSCTSLADARNDNNSQNSSIYVAGKAKYCKESAVPGYLDCFYASWDACERHNKSAALQCVANPNSGT